MAITPTKKSIDHIRREMGMVGVSYIVFRFMVGNLCYRSLVEFVDFAKIFATFKTAFSEVAQDPIFYTSNLFPLQGDLTSSKKYTESINFLIIFLKMKQYYLNFLWLNLCCVWKSFSNQVCFAQKFSPQKFQKKYMFFFNNNIIFRNTISSPFSWCTNHS